MTSFYGVAKGRQTGVFTTWEECEAQVEDFDGAWFQKFDTQKEAELFVKDPSSGGIAKPPVNKVPAGKENPTHYYVVAKGRIPGIYYRCSDAKKQTVDFKGKKSQNFDNLKDAELYYVDHCN